MKVKNNTVMIRWKQKVNFKFYPARNHWSTECINILWKSHGAFSSTHRWKSHSYENDSGENAFQLASSRCPVARDSAKRDRTEKKKTKMERKGKSRSSDGRFSSRLKCSDCGRLNDSWKVIVRLKAVCLPFLLIKLHTD